MQLTNNPDKEKLESLAGYLAHGIKNEQAGAAVGYSASRVSQLLQDEEFLELLAEKTAQMTMQYMDLNKQYDELEKRSLGNLLTHVKINSDPDLNLRVAMLANRAVRKGQNGPVGQPIAPSNNGSRIALNLSVQFVKMVQDGRLASGGYVEGTAEELQTATPQIIHSMITGKNPDGSVNKDTAPMHASILDVFGPVD